MTLPQVAASCARLLEVAGVRPVALVGHSAGAAIAIRMALDNLVRPRVIVGFNASLRPFAGAAGPVFSALARVLYVNPMTPRLFAASATERRVARLLADTGSKVDREGLRLYHTLLRRSGHVSGALAMMAGWDLKSLQRELSRLDVPLTLVAAMRDRTINPADAGRAAQAAPKGRVVRMPDLGHLAHEEYPAAASDIVRQIVADEMADGEDMSASRG
jgi:magnesium chelatase accessory protein